MNILKTMYHEVYTLRSWFDDYPVESFCNKLSEAEDSDSFINFIDTTIVAIPNGAKRLSVKPSLCQHSHQREIIMRVIERLIKEMKSENVLALGFGEVSDDPNAYMSNTCRVECRHPNSAVNRLHFPEWKKVLSRIGDIMMEHLLENTAIFTFIPPSNYIQLTGKAIFDLWKPGLSVKCPAKELCEKDSMRDQQVPLSEHLNAAVRSSQTYCITEDLEELKSEAKAFSKNKVIASSTAKERRKKHWEEKKKKWKSYALGQGLKKDGDRNLKEKIGFERQRDNDFEVKCGKLQEGFDVNKHCEQLQEGFDVKKHCKQLQEGFDVNKHCEQLQEGFVVKKQCKQLQEGFDVNKHCEQLQEGFDVNKHCEQLQEGFDVKKQCEQLQEGFDVNKQCEQLQKGFDVNKHCEQLQEGFDVKKQCKQLQEGFDVNKHCEQLQEGFDVNKHCEQLQEGFDVKKQCEQLQEGFDVNKQCEQLQKGFDVNKQCEQLQERFDMNTQCEQLQEGFDVNKQCEQLQKGFDVNKQCEQLQKGFDVNKQCEQLQERFDMNTQCEQLQEGFDVNKQCEQLQKGFDVNKQCEQLQKGFDVNKQCEQLQKGFDVNKQCEQLQERFDMNTQCEQLQEGFDVNKQCEQLQKGFDVNKQCEQLQKGFDVNKQCEQLQKGFDVNKQCEQLQERFDMNTQCEQLQEGFDVNKQCEQLQEGFDVNKHCEQLKFPGSKISKRQKRKLKQKEQRSKRKKEKNEVATEADINDSCHREQIYLNYFDASGSPSCKRQKLEITNEEYEPSCSVAISHSSIGRMPPWKPQQFSSSRPQPPFGVMTSRSPSKTFQLSDMLEFHPSETSQQFFPIRPRPSFDTMSHSTQLNTSKLCQQRHRERTNKRLSKKNQRKLRLQHRNEMRDKQNKEGGTQSISMEEISLSVCESNPENNTLQKASSFQNQYFPRKSILCSRGLVEQIPKSYILNRLSRDEHGAKELSQEIFKDVSGHTDLYQTRVLPALEKMLNSHKKCSYHQLLNQCFSGEYQQSSTGRREIIVAREKIRKSTYGNVGNQGHVRVKPGTRWTKRSQKVSTKTLLSRHLQTSKIFMFLRRVLTRVIPDELLGKSNKNKLCKYIKPFLNLRKYDKFSLAELKVDQMKLEDIPWLAAVALRADQLHLLSQVICWIFKDYVMVLLRSFLYITETAHHRNRLLYFRKRDWLRLHMQGLNTLLNKKMIEPITQTEAQKQLAEGSALGVASLRFLPKMKSLRPLVNLGRKPPPGCKQKIPMNRQMLHMLNILNYYKDKNPDLVGSAIFGLDKVYPMWKQFALQYRQQGHRRSGIAPLYFVKVDIATCFEDINPEKLFSILKDIFLKDEEDYHINKYVTMFVAGGQVKRTFRRKALPLSEFNPLFTNFVKETVERENLKNNIFVDQVVSQSENSQHLLKQLKSHLFNNLIKVGKKYYRQASGISQGSILSTMLCNLYYGHFEKKLFSLLEGEELRMRIVDDSLFVTPHKDRAIYFLNLMFKGMADYNLHVNPDKVLLNFPLEQNDIGSFPVIQTEWFPWCGMLFNTLTLQASMDFSRYAGISVADTMSFDLSEDLLMTLKQKLLHALKPKNLVIYMDTELNTTEIVVTNIFKIFVLNALKFHSYHRRLPQNFTYNGEAFIDLLMGIGSYFYYQAHAFLTKKGSIPAVFSIPKDVVLWLGLHAFHVVLQQYKTEWQHKNFIMALTRQLRFIMARLEYQEEGLSAVLLRVCGNQVPDELMDLIP